MTDRFSTHRQVGPFWVFRYCGRDDVWRACPGSKGRVKGPEFTFTLDEAPIVDAWLAAAGRLAGEHIDLDGCPVPITPNSHDRWAWSVAAWSATSPEHARTH